MADPVRSDDTLSNMRSPETPLGSEPRRSGVRPVTTSADILNERPALPERATQKPLGEWPEGSIPRGRYQGAAENVGGRLGVAVDRARQLPGYMSERMQDLKRRFRVIRGRAGETDVANDLKQKAVGVADAATRTAEKARTRADHYAHHYPLQFIAGAAAAGFVVGFLLRMGRDE